MSADPLDTAAAAQVREGTTSKRGARDFAVDRAISHYFHEVRMGRETLSPERAFELESERLAAAKEAGHEGVETLLHACYAARGHYHREVRRYMDLFGHERVLVLGSGELFKQPAACLARTFDFLGLDGEVSSQPYKVRNRGTSRQDVPETVRQSLRASFEEPNEALWALLGHRLDW
jgi:hypothetical protein